MKIELLFETLKSWIS